MDSFVELPNFIGGEFIDVEGLHIVDPAGFLEGGLPVGLLNEPQEGLKCVHTLRMVQITFTLHNVIDRKIIMAAYTDF